jgi:hypothetical protein
VQGLEHSQPAKKLICFKYQLSKQDLRTFHRPMLKKVRRNADNLCPLFVPYIIRFKFNVCRPCALLTLCPRRSRGRKPTRSEFSRLQNRSQTPEALRHRGKNR